MIEQEVEIPTPDGNADGWFIRPDAEGALPGVIFLADIGGIRAANLEMAARIAAEGFSVLVPNVFYRTRRPPIWDHDFRTGGDRSAAWMAEIRGPLTPEAQERDGGALVDFLAGHGFVSRGPMGVAGYCFTGGMALRIAAARPERVGAAASFHGVRLWSDDPASPHRLLPRILARLYFGHAVEDRAMPEESVRGLEQALEAWGGKYESETYEGAFHSWTVPDSPIYNKAAADRAFEKVTGLFAAALG